MRSGKFAAQALLHPQRSPAANHCTRMICNHLPTPHSETQVHCWSRAFHYFLPQKEPVEHFTQTTMAESTPELGSLFQQCLDDFRGLLQELEKYQNKLPEEDYPASPPLLIQAIDQYGRLRIWIHDFRADLPDRSRSSSRSRSYPPPAAP